jgi:hypothetical protein
VQLSLLQSISASSSSFASSAASLSAAQNGVLGGTSLLLESSSNLNVEQKEILEIIKTSGEVMLTLINGQSSHSHCPSLLSSHWLPALHATDVTPLVMRCSFSLDRYSRSVQD